MSGNCWLNIGIVDPGYEGYLSTTLLNFGKMEFPLHLNDVFLRLSFLDCYRSPRSDWPTPVALEDYVRDKKNKVVNFSKTFLNLEATVKEVSEPLFDDLKKKLLLWIPGAAFSLALFTFLVTLGVNYTSRAIWTREQLKAELLKDIDDRKSAALETRIKDIEERNSAVFEARIKELEQQLQKLSLNQATPEGRSGNSNAAGRGNRRGR